MKLKSQKDFFAGLMFMVVGASFAWGATSYSIGTGARMGPGYFPLILGIILAALGLLVIFSSLVVETEDGEPVGRIAWKPLFFIIASNVAFGILLGGLPNVGFPSFGLIAGIFALVFVASHAGDKVNYKETLVLAVILAIFSYVAFIKLLGLQFPVWPSFLTA